MNRHYSFPEPGGDEKICSVTTGLVRKNWDKDHPGMLQVEYFLGTEGKNVTGWVPFMVPYAFKECGMYALPEIGSEVVLAFNMGDRNCPLVIGCLWNRKNTLPEKTAVEHNTVKRFRTKGGCEVVFNEEKGKEHIEIHTPKELHIRIDDEKQMIELSDKGKKNGLTIHEKEGSVKLHAEKKLMLEVGGGASVTLDKNSVNIKAGDIKLNASKSFEAKGQSTKLEGTQLKVEGKSQMELKSGGIAQVKGTMLKLN